MFEFEFKLARRREGKTREEMQSDSKWLDGLSGCDFVPHCNADSLLYQRVSVYMFTKLEYHPFYCHLELSE